MELSAALSELDVAAPADRSGGRRRAVVARRVLGAVVLVLAGVLMAALGAHKLARSDSDRARLASHLVSADVASSLKLAILHEEDLTASTSAFVAGNPNASAADFDRWIEAMHAMHRYPELQNIGLVRLVPASRLKAFEAHMAAHPLRPLGPRSEAPKGSLAILPQGNRAFYCLAVTGLARNAASYLPAGLDYCALIKTMITARDSGLAGYAPLIESGTTALGVETPVYRGGVTPSTLAARRRAFVGWLGERLEPKIVMERALDGHRDVAVAVRFDSRFSHVKFANGSAPSGAQSTQIPLLIGREAGLTSSREGWSLQSYTAKINGGILSDHNALALLIGGILLSALLGLLVLVLATGRMRALSLVRAKTRELSEKNRALSYQALHDALTELPNRALVLDRAERMLARAARDPHIVAGALFVDIDNFKDVNDSLGHAAGDQLLKVVGQRLASTVRDQDTVGRLGGDEFVVLVESSVDDAAYDVLAERMTASLREPVDLKDGRKAISITASIGVAAGQFTTADELLHDADLALYSAKTKGKNRYTLFNADSPTNTDQDADATTSIGV
jgi:diguanylate cyclase (GGDEF)-like protein